MKKIIIALLVLLIVTGCTSYTELNELGIISVLGMDYQDGEYYLYANIIEGKQDDQRVEKENTSFTSHGKTIESAIQQIYLKSNKKVYLSHLNLLLLSENILNSKTKEIVYSFLTNPEARNQFHMAVLKTGNMAQVFKVPDIDDHIYDLLKTNGEETGFTRNIDFETFIKDFFTYEGSYLPTINYDDNFKADGFVLIENSKVKRYLSKEDSIILNLLSNHLEKAIILDTPVFSNRTFISSKKNEIEILIQSSIDEDNNKKYSKDVKDQVKKFLEETIEQNEDPLKLQELIRKNNYDYYKKNKSELLSKLKFVVKVETSINQSEINKEEIIREK